MAGESLCRALRACALKTHVVCVRSLEEQLNKARKAQQIAEQQLQAVKNEEASPHLQL